MTKRLASTTLAALLAFGITACGGGGSTGPTPLPQSRALPAQAAVTFNVDPSPIITIHPGLRDAHGSGRLDHAGTGVYGFEVNLAFSESAGVGYTVDTVHARLSGTVSGFFLQTAQDSVKRHVPANERRVFQYTSPLFHFAPTGTIGLTCDFTAAVTDDRGHSISVSTQAEVKRP